MSIEKCSEGGSNSVIRCYKEVRNFNCRAKNLGDWTVTGMVNPTACWKQTPSLTKLTKEETNFE
jgi:hypothetical protein